MNTKEAIWDGMVALIAVVFAVLVGALAAVIVGCAPASALRRLEAENAALRERLDGDNEVREVLLAECNEARVVLEVECVADRVTVGEMEYCPEFEACMQDCITGPCADADCGDTDLTGD